MLIWDEDFQVMAEAVELEVRGHWRKPTPSPATSGQHLLRRGRNDVAMSTAVRMGEGAKDRLEELQALVKLETGRQVTLIELLDRIVEHGYEDRDAIVDDFREPDLPLSEEEKERFFSGTSDWGVETTEEEIDEILYGEGHEDPV